MKPMTITQAAEHFAGTGLTRTAIRRAILQGDVPHVRVGKKYIVTLEGIDGWLSGGQQRKPEKPVTVNGIRRIEE